jgi:hypothetical protein
MCVYEQVRRSPRKLMSPGKEDRHPSASWLKLASPSLPPSSPAAGTPPLTADTTPAILRKSPRKQLTASLSGSRPGFSKLTITGNSILAADGSPSPSPTATTTNSSLVRTPSFTMLEPASYAAASQLSASQTTDTFQVRVVGRKRSYFVCENFAQKQESFVFA